MWCSPVWGSSVAVSADARDNVGVVGVQFKLDGANLGAEDTGAPYSVTWNTTTIANGTHTLSAVARDAAGNQTTATALSVVVNNQAVVPTYVYLPFEAESARMVPPMAVASDTNAGQGQFILSSISDSGSVTFDVNIPVSGVYSIWSRVLSPDDSRDSFYVSVDGGSEDIYDTAEGTRTNAWQWTVVNGRGGTNFTTALAINPRTFRLGAGLHSIVFRGQESGTGLDQILLTNDPDYVPNVVFSTTTLPVRISSIAFGTAGHVTLAWPTVPGKTYRVVYKTNLTDAVWETLGSDQTATNTITSRSDYVVGNRFYSVITRP